MDISFHQKNLDKNGFTIINNLIKKETVSEIRNYWIDNLNNSQSISADLCFGQANYTKNFFNRYQRHFDFYWNKPESKLTRNLSLQLHFIRNIFTNYDPLYGLQINDKKFGIYLAITRYPSNSGEMAVHVDPNSYLPVHYNLPLTFKGEDYEKGGLKIMQNNNFIDIESLINIGDMILFNGSIPHKIDMIEGKGSKSDIGRMQMFSVPTIFDQVNKRGFIKDIIFELYGRFKYYNYKKGKGLNRNYHNLR